MGGSEGGGLAKVGGLLIKLAGRNQRPSRPNRTEPNRLILEPAGTGRGNEPNQTGPSHYGSKIRMPNRVEPGNCIFRTEPNRTEPMNCSKSPEPKRIEPKRFLPASGGRSSSCAWEGLNVVLLPCASAWKKTT